MTLEQTRQLGIEFERRIQALMPSEEFDNKLDTDTIYAYLNEYQMQYVHDIYRNLDRLEPGTTLTSHVESVLQSMMSSVTLPTKDSNNNNAFLEDITDTSNWNDVINDCTRSKTWVLPKNYYMYIRSVSNVSKTYSWRSGSNNKISILPNVYTKQTDIWKVLETPHNSLRILRYPVVVLSQYANVNATKDPTITVIYDRYTDVEGIKVIYYKQPQYFSLMTSTPCELPMDSFDDIVSGAVQLFINYAGGQIRQQKENEKKAQEQAEKQNRQQSNSNE